MEKIKSREELIQMLDYVRSLEDQANILIDVRNEFDNELKYLEQVISAGKYLLKRYYERRHQIKGE